MQDTQKQVILDRAEQLSRKIRQVISDNISDDEDPKTFFIIIPEVIRIIMRATIETSLELYGKDLAEVVFTHMTRDCFLMMKGEIKENQND